MVWITFWSVISLPTKNEFYRLEQHKFWCITWGKGLSISEIDKWGVDNSVSPT
jgi:hypothetical protein